MSWWGKVVGGTIGLMLGGPLGALIGTAFGHSFDKKKTRGAGQIPGDQERVQAAFFAATFSIMGYVSKADGKVTPEEIDLARTVMTEMSLDASQRELAKLLFQQGKEPSFDADAILQQFRYECHRRTTLIQLFLEIQIESALADGQLHNKEESVLLDIASKLGITDREYRGIFDRVSGMQSGYSRVRSNSSKEHESDPYMVLGVTRDTPLHEIKKAYRRLMSQHHPDKLVSKGLPEEMVRIANQKTHEIRTAWKTIQAQHG
ncbi:MAG: co-chaperone DjlA [Gammaproteobacteria bacterium]|nr:co-chaperone DjlA [Gammaproteobacteria bacterium]MCY4219263.1 co-chaperone DjlA [Gammaproteobacteria bacterium]MCY4275377.1 co-chaperone DjlA [Gammaproteobacteria bacterium]